MAEMKHANSRYAQGLMELQLDLGWQIEGVSAAMFPCDPLPTLGPIRYSLTRREVQQRMLDELRGMGIPADTDRPFAADWVQILPTHAQAHPKIAGWVASLVHVEWSLSYWLEMTRKLGLHEVMAQHAEGQALIEHLTDEKVVVHGVSFDVMAAKWWTDDLVIRLRTAWDRALASLQATCDEPFPWSDETNKRIARLREYAHLFKLDADQEMFDALCSEAEKMKNDKNSWLDKYRNNEIHQHTPSSAEIFGKDDDMPLHERWTQLLEPEVNKVREALVTTIAILLRRRG